MKNFVLHSFFYILLLQFSACEKETNPVPYTSVSVYIQDIESDPRYSNLRVELHSAKVYSNDCLGYNCNGIILYRARTMQQSDDYEAYDLTCTYEADSCTMTIDPAFPYLLTCPCCGSVYNLVGGYMEKGPAKFPLRKFNCDFLNGDLRIY